MTFLIGLAVTPLAALVGTLIVFVGMDILLGPQLMNSGNLVLIGIVVGSVIASPVTIGVLPLAVSRGATLPRALMWGAGSGFLASFSAVGILLGANARREVALALLVLAAGSAAGGVAALVMATLAAALKRVRS